MHTLTIAYYMEESLEILIWCPKCGASHYKVKDDDSCDVESIKGPTAKVMWQLPIIPRFKRLFVDVNNAKNVR